jgi:hypothetical protein
MARYQETIPLWICLHTTITTDREQATILQVNECIWWDRLVCQAIEN